jgi:hypothetical protein
LEISLSPASTPQRHLSLNNPPKPLLLHLRLRRRNHTRRIRVAEPTPRLAVLLARCLGTADTRARGGNLTAASGAAVGVGDAAAGDELCAVAGADVLGARGVGGYLREGEGRDCGALVRRQM